MVSTNYYQNALLLSLSVAMVTMALSKGVRKTGSTVKRETANDWSGSMMSSSMMVMLTQRLEFKGEPAS